jgi:hypothetical protein
MDDISKFEGLFQGSCFCSAVQFQIEGLPSWSVICHCTICARLSGSSGVDLVAWRNPEAFKVVEGEDKLTHFNSSPGMRRSFCKVCGSPVVNKSLTDDMVFFDVPLTLFKRNDREDIIFLPLLKAKSHLFYKRRLHNHPDGLDKFETYPFGEPLKVDAAGNVLPNESSPAPPQQ